MTVTKAAEASKRMVESRKSNGLGGGAEFPHSAEKPKATPRARGGITRTAKRTHESDSRPGQRTRGGWREIV